MFTNNYISLSDVDDVVSRDSVPTGAVFAYTGGTGRNYCALGTIHRNIEGSVSPYFVSMKPDVGQAIHSKSRPADRASIAITPVNSNHISRSCQIVGAFKFALTYHEVASIRALGREDHHKFGTLLSLRGATDTHGNSHIYMMLGTNVDHRVMGHMLLRLTHDEREQSQQLFHVVDDHALVAVRGDARMTFEHK